MSRVRTFLITAAIWIVLGFASYGVICTAYGNVAQAKSQQPGCTQFATVGQVTIYRCVDEAGNVFAANDVGMMTSLGN
jgi:hypothetical protein